MPAAFCQISILGCSNRGVGRGVVVVVKLQKEALGPPLPLEAVVVAVLKMVVVVRERVVVVKVAVGISARQ